MSSRPSARLLHSADGQPLALHDFGGSGPVLLMTHGNGLNAGMWVSVAAILRDQFHCYGLDFRGHGAAVSLSPAGQPGLEMAVDRDRYAEDLRAAVEALGGPRILGVGHSLGGVASVYSALRWPGLFRAMWLYEPVLVPATFERGPFSDGLAEASRRRRQVFDSVQDAVARFQSKPPFNVCRPEPVTAYAEIGTFQRPDGSVQLCCSGDNEARVFASGAPQDFSQYAAIACPTIVACGGTAHLGETPAIVAPLVAEALGNARLERYDDLTHFGPMEDPERMAASILAHFAPFRN